MEFYQELLPLIKNAYEEKQGILGYRQMTIKLNREHEFHVNSKRIYRLMSILNLKSVCRKKKKNYKKTTPQVTAENTLNRNFNSDKFGEKWLTDMTQSMSRLSRCIDNGPMEAFWGMLKSEMYYLRKFNSYSELESVITDYINYYNNQRYQKRLKCMTPLEYREYLKSVA
ncbi:IS3 family transposase [Clostridium botulinum]|uniref:IS3 family transposase n=1 Tax=Clostridium botulinum TaxID=1491 RepID=UPI00096CD638|nr:IS3 family transposase [Clostridium botulinum]MBE1306070.1 IS3 family transposase [Clostridium botulinum]MBN3416661.1 hypothetical protein [Clostridium botulinum]MBN3443152.1 hypothetical protein [Clostridium botulinum]MBY6807117.1 IS3 family transposase [Clostridium botulinum]MCS4470217.1 IS3 family transposase [Clostridium botulinum]